MMIINYIFFITLSLDSVMIPTILFFITLSISIVTLPMFVSKLKPQTVKEWFEPSVTLFNNSTPILFQNASGLLFDQTYQSLRVGTQAISFYNYGSEIVRITSGGVGIGTTNSEQHKLYVNGGISLGNDLMNGKRYIGLTNPTDLSVFQGIVFTSRANESSISMYTSNKEQMKVDSFGNVYINSSTFPNWGNFYGQVNPPFQTLTVGGSVVSSRPVYFRGVEFGIHNGTGVVITSPSSTPVPNATHAPPSSTSFYINNVYYFQPNLISSKQHWNPSMTAGCLTIPYQGLYQFQLSIGFPYTENMTLFISKNIGKGKEPTATGNSQMVGIKQVSGLEGTLMVTCHLLLTDVIYFGMILHQNYVELLRNKCSITATLLKQTL